MRWQRKAPALHPAVPGGLTVAGDPGQSGQELGGYGHQPPRGCRRGRGRPRVSLRNPGVAAGGCGAPARPGSRWGCLRWRCVTARCGAGAGLCVHALRPPRRPAGPGAGPAGADAAADRGDPAGPDRTRCQRGHVHATDRPARRGRERTVLRPDRLPRRRAPLHRPDGHPGRGGRLRAAAARLARAGRPPVLPGHPGLAGRRPPPPPHQDAAPRGDPPGRRGARPRRRRAGRPGRRPDRRGVAARGAERQPHRPDDRHRRDHPGRAGLDHPLPAQGRAGRPGRPGHREDRGRPAPRRVPPLHLPRAARAPGGAGHRAEPDLPALRGPGAALPGRDLGPDVDHRRPVPGRHRTPRRARRGREGQRQAGHGQGDRRCRAGPAGGIAVRAGGPLRAGRAAARPARVQPDPGPGPAQPGCRTTRPGGSLTACSSTP